MDALFDLAQNAVDLGLHFAELEAEFDADFEGELLEQLGEVEELTPQGVERIVQLVRLALHVLQKL